MQKKIKKNVSPRIFEEAQEFYRTHFDSTNAEEQRKDAQERSAKAKAAISKAEGK